MFHPLPCAEEVNVFILSTLKIFHSNLFQRPRSKYSTVRGIFEWSTTYTLPGAEPFNLLLRPSIRRQPFLLF